MAIVEQHDLDAEGRPAGGETKGRGIYVQWQKGALVNPETGERREPSGAFVEDVIRVAMGRLEHYQSTRFRCRENAAALVYLNEALHQLELRTADRTARGVEGTHEV